MSCEKKTSSEFTGTQEEKTAEKYQNDYGSHNI
jgi:hypothetical protein